MKRRIFKETIGQLEYVIRRAEFLAQHGLRTTLTDQVPEWRLAVSLLKALDKATYIIPLDGGSPKFQDGKENWAIARIALRARKLAKEKKQGDTQ